MSQQGRDIAETAGNALNNGAKISGSQAQSQPQNQAPTVGDSAREVANQTEQAIRNRTAVTTTLEPPGVSVNDKDAGTALPVAHLANKDALNAGVQPQPAKPLPEQPAKRVASNSQANQRYGVANQKPIIPPKDSPQRSAPPVPVAADPNVSSDPKLKSNNVSNGKGTAVNAAGAISKKVPASGPPPNASGSTGTPTKPGPAKTPASVSKSLDPELVKRKEAEAKGTSKVAAKSSSVGWKEVGGWDEQDKDFTDEELTDLLDRSTLLENYISDKYYGDWYQNTALIVFASFFSWLVARLGGGIAWLFIVLAFAGTAYRTSIRRLRRNVRDDIIRESGLKKLETDTESLEWLNSFLIKFWLIYEPVLAEIVIGTANQVLSGSTPGFIESLTLDTFTLGTKPPRVDHVRTFPKTEEDVAVMDWKFSFTPNDTQDLTARQLKSKVNPKVELGVRIGKGVVSKSLPILVENMSFSGLMRVRIKMITTFPHVQTVDVSFLEPPSFDFVLKPIGGDTFGFDINIIPGLQSFITEMVHSNLGPMLYAPNAFQLNIQQMLAGSGVDSAIGVLAITAKAAQIRKSDSVGNTMDPYIKFSFNNRAELARTDIKSETKNPVWNETKYLLVNNLNESLTMEVIDFNDFRKDKTVGIVNFPLDSLLNDADHEDISGDILDGAKNRGSLSFDVHWFPVLVSKTLEDGTEEPPPESKSGIVKFTIHQCKDLDAKKSMVGQLSPYVDFLLNDRLLHQSKSLKRTNNPVWDESHEFLVTDRNRCKLGARVKDSRGMAADPVVGSYDININNLLESLEKGNDWFNLSPSGRIRLSATWKSVGLKGVAGSISKPIGAVRFHFIKAEGLRNLETLGKVDPYMRVFVNGYQRGRTHTVSKTMDPEWDSVVYAVVQSSNQKITLEVMDSENLGKDRTLGSFDLKASEFIKQDDKGNYVDFVDPKVRTGQFSLPKKGVKGTLHYTVSFFPVIPVMDPEDALEAKKKKAKEKEEAENQDADSKGKDKEKDSDAATLAEPEESAGPKEVDIPLDELLKFECGTLLFTIVSAHVSDVDTYVRVLFDDASVAAHVTPKLKILKSKLLESGDTVIRELEYSRTIIQLVSKSNPRDEDIISSVTIPTMKLLHDGYDQDTTLILTPPGAKTSSKNSRIVLNLRYYPLLMKLDPSESVNNQGTLRVEVLDAAELPAADRSGFSDPYASFSNNGSKVFKTKTQKKTLNPVWNESFEVEIPSRIAAQFEVEVYDWDMGPGDDDFLGSTVLDLASLEPLQPVTNVYPLNGKSGSIRLKLFFKPGYVTITRRNSATATFTGVIGAPGKAIPGATTSAKAVGTIGSTAASGIGGVVSGVGSGLKSSFGGLRGKGRKDAGHEESPEPQTEGPAAGYGTPTRSTTNSTSNNNTPLGHHGRTMSVNSQTSSFPSGDITPAQLSLFGARGFDSVSHLQVRVYLVGKKEKEIHKTKAIKPSGGEVKFDETFNFKAAPDAQLIFRARDHKSLGRDEDLGEAVVHLSEVSGQTSLTIADKGQLFIQIAPH